VKYFDSANWESLQHPAPLVNPSARYSSSRQPALHSLLANLGLFQGRSSNNNIKSVFF